MKSVLFVTYIDFWATGAGHRSRLSALIGYLRGKIDVTVAYVGMVYPSEEQVLEIQFPEVKIIVLEKRKLLSYAEYANRLRAAVTGVRFDATVIEYLELAFMLNYVDHPGKKVLDPHDILNEKLSTYKHFNFPYQGLSLTGAEEFDLYREFDYVLAIQESDRKTISQEIGEARTILVPHPVDFRKQELRRTLSTLGFVGSEYPPNVDGIVFFLREVWNVLHETFNLRLNIFGNVCLKLTHEFSKERGVTLQGFTREPSEIYSKCDLMINPVRMGAGLKIKNVEAIGNGLPLITTSHGAIGMQGRTGQHFLVADHLEAWVDGC